MGYSASAVAIIGVKLPREKVFKSIEVPHRCEFMPDIMPAVAFRFCPYCGKSAKTTTQEVCVFSDDVDWIAMGDCKVNGLDFYLHEKPRGEKDYYLGIRVDKFLANKTIREQVYTFEGTDLFDRILDVLNEYKIEEFDVDESKYQFGLHVLLEESC